MQESLKCKKKGYFARKCESKKGEVRNVQPNLGSREKYTEKWAKSDKLSSGNPNLHLLPSSKEM